MAQLLCPVVLGRDAEQRVLADALAAAAAGHGHAIVLAGEPGIGKSRLARECAVVAEQRGMAVLVGRAVSGPAPVAYRPISEALAAAIRTGRAHGAEISLRGANALEAGEALLARLRDIAEQGAVLILEDLHWADPETLALLEYIAPNLTEEGVLVVGTCRLDGGAGAATMLALAARRSATLIELEALTDAEVGSMVAACTHGLADAELIENAKAFGEGLPFLVEELVAAWPRRLPKTFAASVRERLDAFPAKERRAVETAAVLGREIEWQLVGASTGEPTEVVAAALARGVTTHLLSADGHEVRFRHALTRDAIVDALLPPVRAAIAGRALEAVEAAHPDLPGEWCDVAVRLAQDAGLAERAGELLWTSAQRALRRGALISAERALRSARELGADTQRLYDIDEALLGVLALAGKNAEADAIGVQLLERPPPEDDPARRRGIHLRLARAAVAGQQWKAASDHLSAAEQSTRRGHDIAPSAEIDALAAHVAIGTGDFDTAEQRARDAVDSALAVGATEVACEALEVLGRNLRRRDLDEAEAVFARGFELAEHAGLELWAVRALHEWGTIDFFRTGQLVRLEQARLRAVHAGAVVTTAIIDLQLAAGYQAAMHLDASLAAARRCQEASRRFGLGLVEGLALQLEATTRVLGNDPAATEAGRDRLPPDFADDPEVVAGYEGGVLAVAALIADDNDRALHHLERAMEQRRRISAPPPAPVAGGWLLLLAAKGADITDAAAEVEASGATISRANRGLRTLADAIVLGRDGEADAAASHVESGLADLAYAPWHAHLGRRFVAEAALNDKWGSPERWLEEAATFFTSVGHGQLAAACNGLLRRAGRSVPRPSPLSVPLAWRDLGITAREAEVLALIGEGESTRDMAERLYISHRTVEKHIESLQRKTGQHTRSRLVAFAAASR